MFIRLLYRGLLYAGNLFRGLLYTGQEDQVVTPRRQEPARWGYVTRTAVAGQVDRDSVCGTVTRSARWGY